LHLHQGKDSLKSLTARTGSESPSPREVMDYELQLLGVGPPETVYLNLAIFFLTTAFSFLTILLADISESSRILTTFEVIVGAEFTAGGLILVFWTRSRNSRVQLLKRSRNRWKQKIGYSAILQGMRKGLGPTGRRPPFRW
jgi:hypothetical protein